MAGLLQRVVHKPRRLLVGVALLLPLGCWRQAAPRQHLDGEVGDNDRHIHVIDRQVTRAAGPTGD